MPDKHKPVYLTWRGRTVCQICGKEEAKHVSSEQG